MAYRTSEKVRQKKDAKRTALMQTALQVFAEKGYHAATVRDIVNKAGVAIGTFYFYFPDKETLFSYLYEETAEFLVLSVEQSMMNRSTIHQQIMAAVQGYINIALYEPAVIHLLLIGGIGAIPSLMEKRSIFRERIVQMWFQLLESAAEQDLIPQQNLRRVAEAVAGACDEVLLHLLEQPTREAESEAATRDLTIFILRAIGFRSQAADKKTSE
ncbi:MAG: TetR/AcrR family transcriptional regulator [Chloroflexota bacterium]